MSCPARQVYLFVPPPRNAPVDVKRWIQSFPVSATYTVPPPATGTPTGHFNFPTGACAFHLNKNAQSSLSAAKSRALVCAPAVNRSAAFRTEAATRPMHSHNSRPIVPISNRLAGRLLLPFAKSTPYRTLTSSR